MDAADKRMLEREALRNMIQQWNANRLDLFELSEPNENLEFHGVMRFYFQDSGQKIATKCIRVASDATVSDVIETLIEKFRPDMRMLSLGSYSLWETHGPDDERRLEPHEKPLLVQLNWHADDREGRFLLKCSTSSDVSLSTVNEKGDQNFKRKLSKREKKELKKKEKLSRLKSDTNNENRPVAEKLYTELPETSFTRSISNPEAVMRRRRQQKLERKLQQFRSKDGGPDTGGTLKIYGSSLSPDVPYKTLLLSVGDTAAGVVREMLDKYGLSRHEPQHFCVVQVDTADNSESILEDDECPLAIVMTHPHRSSIMFHVRRRPADAQPRRRKKKTAGAGAGCGAGGSSARPGCEPVLVEVAPDGSPLENGRRVRITGDLLEVGSGNGSALQLYGPSIQPRHCVVAAGEAGGFTATPLHADAQVYVNGRRAVAPHSLPLQHGCLIKFGRVSTFRFMDPNQENMINRNLSQSQHFGSGSIYDRSVDEADEYRSPSPADGYHYRDDTAPYNHNNNNNTLKLDNESVLSHASKDEYSRDEPAAELDAPRGNHSHYKDNYETTFDLDGNVETKSICSAKSGGSGHDNRMSATVGSAARPGQEAILPAVLEFPEAGQAQFLAAVITRLDPHAPAFKLAPVYTLYLCARYRASTHYRPELTPTERAHKLTAFLHHVATLIHATVQERCTDSAAQAFWMANASELLHFLKCDRHISSFSTQAQELLPATVQNAFSNLVSCFQEELSRALSTLTEPALGDATEATAPTLQALAAAMVLLRRCRVNAALTIQLFSHLFHYINAVCFNKLVTEPGTVSARWGVALAARLALLAAWAERQGLELPADCHLARTHQAARLISGTYRTGAEARAALAACFKLNSVQVRALLTPLAPPDVVDAAAAHARALADELCRADGREITLEESCWLGAGLLIPGDGFSAEVVRGVPPGLAEFVAPLQRGGLCRLAHQPHARGVWTVYMAGYGAAQRRPPDAAVHIIQLHKNCNGMGLSIVAAKGAGQSKLGIYIKSVVAGGAAAADGRLAAGDQLLSVDGQSLVGITQEKAAEFLVRTGPTVTLEVAKQGAVLHGLATLLHQPAYNQKPGEDEGVQYEDRRRRNSGTYTNPHPALLRPASPRSELATAGYRRPCHDRCHLLRDESTESSTSESEECRPHYHGSIPRLVITLDRENNQLREAPSPAAAGAPPGLPAARALPVFTFTCEDFDDQPASDSGTYDSHVPRDPTPPPAPPAPPPPTDLPPQMRPIDTRLTLELFRARRCTAAGECASACSCCRAPQPEPPLIPYIDEPALEPLIAEQPPPRTRRILPALSLDRADDAPRTADAGCQTPDCPMDVDDAEPAATRPARPPQPAKLQLKLDVRRDSQKISDMHCRLKRALFNMSKSYSRSEDAGGPSTSESCDDATGDECRAGGRAFPAPAGAGAGADRVLAGADRKSWKSPDEFRPAFGRVRALTKQFNDINLRYCVKNYKRNCQSSPNLSYRDEKTYKPKENFPTSASLIDIQYESLMTDTSESRGGKMSEDEVKSILIQLEDWSRYGSRGSGDTLAQGDEFELPNLPCEEPASYVFGEIVDTAPRVITLDNIRLRSNQSSANSDPSGRSGASLGSSEAAAAAPGAGGAAPAAASEARRARRAARSCPDVRAAAPTGAPVAVGAARRASERDLPARLAAEPVKPSKSTPALHHEPHEPQPPPGVSMMHAGGGRAGGGGGGAAVSAAAAAAGAGRSRSSHNLAAAHDGFYQNLPAHEHNLHDRWSSLRSSTGSSRPQSAHYAPAPADAPASPLHQPPNQQSAISVRSAKLAEMSEEVSRRQHMQYQLAQKAATLPQHASHPSLAHLAPPMSPTMHHNHNQHMQQPMQNNMQQAMQNNMQQPMQQGMQQNMQQGMQPGMPPNMQQAMQQNMQQGMQPNMQPGMQQSVQQSMQQSMQQAMQQGMQQGMQPNMQGMPINMQQGNMQAMQNMHQMHQHMHAPAQSPQQPYQHGQPQRYEWHPPGPPSPQRAQPPVAPKPQGVRRAESELEEQYHQHSQPQPATLQPDDERYVASAMEPLAVSPYGGAPRAAGAGAGGAGGAAGGAGGAHNPWQREERERQAEARRAHARSRRDAAIASLAALGAARSPQQSQQLRALQLERDFERRATQHAQEDIANMETGVDEDSPSPPPEPCRPPLEQGRAPPEQGRAQAEQGRAPPPPKSILKTNTPRPEVTNGYAQEMSPVEESVSEAAAGVAALSVAPPPPERGSSFAVMATRARALSPPAHPAHPAHAPHAPHTPHTPHTPSHQPTTPHSPPGQGRDKRVSFHERPAPAPAPAPPAPPASSPPPLDPPAHEDPDRFLEEAESMLATPPAAAAAAAHTPGVIGAQEVYRDPRARRLAEKQQAAASAAPAHVPEHLSFKDKMKMFALEAGDPNTPKDKVKISRAQRDIDAVH